MELEDSVFRERKLNSYANWWCSVAMVYKGEDLCRITMARWGMWKARNEAIFRSSMMCYGEIVARALTHYEAFKNANEQHEDDEQELPSSWSSSSLGLVEINCDAVVRRDCDLGVVVWDEDWYVLAATIKQEQAKWDASIVEAKAMLFVVKVALNYGLDELLFESDYLGIISHLQRGVLNLSSLSVVCNDILNLCSSFQFVAWNHVKQDGNVVTHLLAKSSPIEVGENVG